MNSEYLSFLDVTSTFIWLATLLSIAIIKRKSYTDIHYYRYYLPNLYFKILFSFLFSFFYIIAYNAGGDTGAYFKGATALNNLLLEFVKWNKKTEIKDLAEINIGVMPLEDSIWAQGKCGFKGLQYMALQIPSVMSNVGVNTQIIDDGHNGFICKSKEDWYRVLSSLMSDVKLRTEIGQKGKKTVEHKYSVKANKQKYNSLFK